MKQTPGRVINKEEQNLISIVAAELIGYTKIDYYPSSHTVKIYYYGPKRMTITQHTKNITTVYEE